MFCAVSFSSTLSFSQTANTLPTTGNIGVGTTSPTTKLDVVGNTKLGGAVQIDSTVIIKDSVTIQKRLTIKQDIKVVGKSVFVDNGKFKADLKVLGVGRMKNNLVIDGLTKMNGNAKIAGNLKLTNLTNTTNPAFFLTTNTNGKVMSLDKGGLLNEFYQPQLSCLTDQNGNLLPVWKQNPNPNYGILYTGTDCPARVGIGIDNPQYSLDVVGGVHSFAVTVTDNNACGLLSTPFTYNINVICQYCPLDIYYQDRHPNNKPLPAVTSAGRKIVAGNNIDTNQPIGNVESGSAQVVFEAPQIITLNPGFTGGPNFTAQLEPTTCITECNSCCDNWSGFTADFIPNVFTPNNDGINDVWYIPDSQHPNCAFNAQGFNLIIKTPSGSTIYTLNSDVFSNGCCPFSSPSPCNDPPCFPYPHSSIFWDGIVNTGFFSGTPAPDGTYYYVIEMQGCGNTQSFAGFITILGSSAKIANPDSVPNISELTALDKENLSRLVLIENNILAKQLLIYPNPTKDKINISFTDNSNMQNGNIEIFTMQGKLLLVTKINSNRTTIDVIPI